MTGSCKMFTQYLQSFSRVHFQQAATIPRPNFIPKPEAEIIAAHKHFLENASKMDPCYRMVNTPFVEQVHLSNNPWLRESFQLSTSSPGSWITGERPRPELHRRVAYETNN